MTEPLVLFFIRLTCLNLILGVVVSGEWDTQYLDYSDFELWLKFWKMVSCFLVSAFYTISVVIETVPLMVSISLHLI
jgi:hypothetical protein